MKRYGLPATEKLKSRKAIDALFQGGQRFSVFPLLVWHRWAAQSAEPGLLAGFSCSKKHFKRAVDRNRIKRLMREAYRLQKPALLDALKDGAMRGELFFIFIDKTLPDFESIHAAMGKSLRQLQKKSHEAAH
ncbi:MAG: ribonuclease P protein component [Chitinophagaceae bacterium]|nr:MAG: ribonuclease P protein component [Chitinophagaceae bacterium]